MKESGRHVNPATEYSSGRNLQTTIVMARMRVRLGCHWGAGDVRLADNLGLLPLSRCDGPEGADVDKSDVRSATSSPAALERAGREDPLFSAVLPSAPLAWGPERGEPRPTIRCTTLSRGARVMARAAEDGIAEGLSGCCWAEVLGCPRPPQAAFSPRATENDRNTAHGQARFATACRRNITLIESDFSINR